MDGQPPRALAAALAALRATGHGERVETVLDDYAVASAQIAAADVRFVAPADDVEWLVEAVVVGMAWVARCSARCAAPTHTHLSTRRYGSSRGAGEMAPGERFPTAPRDGVRS